MVKAGVDFGKLKFLVVDDNRFMREICRAMLFSFGTRDVLEAADGADALEQFKDNAPDIVVLDLAMPILDGFDVMRFMRDRATSPNPYVSILVLSAHAERRQVIAARDAGANEYLIKPVSANALYTRVASMVLAPRPFVETKSFFGPDRRRFVNPQFNGPERREMTVPDHLIELAG